MTSPQHQLECRLGTAALLGRCYSRASDTRISASERNTMRLPSGDQRLSSEAPGRKVNRDARPRATSCSQTSDSPPGLVRRRKFASRLAKAPPLKPHLADQWRPGACPSAPSTRAREPLHRGRRIRTQHAIFRDRERRIACVLRDAHLFGQRKQLAAHREPVWKKGWAITVVSRRNSR